MEDVPPIPAPKLLFDSEEKRYIDRIRAVAFREARDAGAKFINKKWIAGRLQRSTEFVKHNWSKSYAECKTTFGGGRPQKLSQESVALVRELSKGSKRKSSVLIAKELETRTNEKISRTTVMRYQKKISSRDTSASKGAKVKAPRKSRSKKKPAEGVGVPTMMTTTTTVNNNDVTDGVIGGGGFPEVTVDVDVKVKSDVDVDESGLATPQEEALPPYCGITVSQVPADISALIFGNRGPAELRVEMTVPIDSVVGDADAGADQLSQQLAQCQQLAEESNMLLTAAAANFYSTAEHLDYGAETATS